MSETEAKPISAAPAEAEKPQTKGKAYKGTPEEERVKILLSERNAARRELAKLKADVRQPKQIPPELIARCMEKVRAAHPDIDIGLQLVEVDKTVFPALLAVNPEAAYRYVVGCVAVMQREKEQAQAAEQAALKEHYRHLAQEHFRKVN